MFFQRSSYISLYTLSKTLEVFLIIINIWHFTGIFRFFFLLNIDFFFFCLRRLEDGLHSKIYTFLARLIQIGIREDRFVTNVFFISFQLFYMNGIQKGNFPYIKHFDTILYTLCTGLMFHAVSRFKFSLSRFQFHSSFSCFLNKDFLKEVIKWEGEKLQKLFYFRSQAILQPAYLKPTYWNFLLKLTGKR